MNSGPPNSNPSILGRHTEAEERFRTWSLEDGDVKFVFSEFKKTRTGTSINYSAMDAHVRYKSLYISYPFPAKQQREMTTFWVV